MIGVTALGARAIGDAGHRDMASEWAGADPALTRTRVIVARDSGRRVRVRKP